MIKSVRRLLLVLLFITYASASVYASADCPLVGAIRWDAWHGKDGNVGEAVERSLGPAEWHYRLPFCGKEVSESKVEIRCNSQEVMDKEIEYAAAAGIDYWAFVVYHPDQAMSLGLKYYLSSKHKDKVRFALITDPKDWNASGNEELDIERYIQLMKEPSYRKVLNNRPLLFMLSITEENLAKARKSEGGLRATILEFRRRARVAGLQDPYIVVMDFKPERAKQLADYFGFDAISAYASPGGRNGAPYSELVRQTERKWERYRATGAKVVPLVMTGWDNRPRAEHTAPWQMKRKDRLGKVYYGQGRPEEIAEHMAHAIRWVDANRDAAEARLIITYAWNEHDEGGWLMPTLSEGPARVDALGRMMRSVCP